MQAETVNMKKEVLERFDVLAAKLGTTAEYLWEVMVRQASVIAIEIVLFAVAVFLASAGLYILVRHRWEKLDMDDSPEPVLYWALAAILAVSDFVAVLGLFMLPTLLMNPEYWALKKVAEMFGQ